MNEIKIRNIMTNDPVWVTPDASVRDVAKVMRRHDIHALPVVRAGGDLVPVGVITDHDIVVRLIAADGAPTSPASDVMTTDHLAVVRSDDDIDQAMAEMTEHHVRRVLVVDDGRLVGILSRSDFLRIGAHYGLGTD